MYLEIFNNKERLKKIIPIVAGIICLLGVGLRFYHITRSEFVFYDEGYYLNITRPLGQLIEQSQSFTANDWWKAVTLYFHVSLAQGKALWFLLVDSRIFWGGLNMWFFSRVLAAVAGVLIFAVLYRFVKRYYGSTSMAWLAVMILAVYPSHVFYSRIGLQETFCTLVLLLGFYFYLFPRQFGPRTFISGIFFAAAFFSNYRMIVLCFHVAVCELLVSLPYGRRPDFRKFMWCMLVFWAGVFLIGNIDKGNNTTVIFAWMFHQANLANHIAFDWANFLSYPYYVLRLDNPIFCAFLFAGVFFLFRKDRKVIFPFGLVLMHMIMFSFPEEKGARYLCVMIPFMVISVVSVIKNFYEDRPSVYARAVLLVLFLSMMGFMTSKSVALAQIQSAYRTATGYLLQLDPQVKFLSTQPYVQNLYVANPKNVEECPRTFEMLAYAYSQGAKYLVVDPQAYVSWAENDERFNPHLIGYLNFVVSKVNPVKVFPHFNATMLERFVFEHNQTLRRSIKFLEITRGHGVGDLRIYETQEIVSKVTAALSRVRSAQGK